MGELPESDKPQRENFSVEVTSALRLKLLEEFDKRYKKPGKKRRRTGEFLKRWDIELNTGQPSDQAVLNVLNGKRDTAEFWLVDGLCRLLIGYSYAEWSKQPIQAQGTSPELPQLSQSGSQVILPCPYRGLDAFRKEDAPFFCGRENFIEQLEVAVRKKPLVAVIGRSGSGKSSVVFAGLIPKLGQKRGWLIRDFRPEKRPFYNLAKALIPLLEPKMTETDKLVEIRKQAEALQQGDLALQDVVEAILQKKPSAQHFLLVVDQFEELYTLCQVAEERQQFLNQLVATVAAAQQKRTPDFTLLITLRDDFLGQAIDYPPFGEQLQQWKPEFILSMNSQELQDAIEKPAQKLDVQLQEGLTKIILDAVSREPGSLPLLEFALKLLWEKQSDGKLTHAAYEEIGGVEKALANHAEDVYQKLTEDEQQRVQHIFTQLVRPGAGTEDTRRLATRTDVGEDNWDLVTYLANQDARLVVTGCDEATGEATVEVVHEALIRGWERLRQWMEADREFRTWQERLRAAMQIWENSRRDEGALLRGALLVEAEDWMKQRGDTINSAEKAFIQASRGHQIEEAQRWKSLYEEAEKQRKIAIAGKLAAKSELLRSQQPDLLSRSVLLAVEAVKRDRSLETDQALREGLRLLPRPIATINHEPIVAAVVFNPLSPFPTQKRQPKVQALAFSPDGEYLATACDDGTARIWTWQTANDKPFKCMRHETWNLSTVVYSPNQPYLVTVSAEHIISVWDTYSEKLIATKKLPNATVTDITFNIDGRCLLITTLNGSIEVWAIINNELQRIYGRGYGYSLWGVAISPDEQSVVISGDNRAILQWKPGSEGVEYIEHEGISAIAFSPKGKYLATAGRDHTARVWDVSNGREIARMPHDPTFSDAWRAVAFSPDGRYLATGNGSKTARVWDAKSGEEVARITHENNVRDIAFYPVPNGRYLVATASGDQTAQVWELDRLPEVACVIHEKMVLDVAFSPDGNYLATASEDGTVRISEVTTGKEFPSISIPDNQPVRAIAFSPDGEYIAITTSRGETAWVQKWKDISSQPFIEMKHTGIIDDVAFSPKGEYVATVSNDHSVKLWDLATGNTVKSLSHESQVQSVAFSPDGKLLTAGSFNGIVLVWDVDTGEEVRRLP